MAVGKSVPMLEGEKRVTGALEYLVNLRLPGMLTGRILRSQSPHAKLLRVDKQQALGMHDVAAILTADDLEPGLTYGAAIKDQPILAFDRVRYVGEPLAAIAAESTDSAEAAMRLIDLEYEELPPVFDALEASQPGASALHAAYPNNIFIHSKLRHGDMRAAFAEADEIFEDTFTSPPAQQASLEPHVCAAQWEGDRLTVWTASQAPYMVRRVLSEIFRLPQDSIRVIVPPLGGSYGGKGHIRIEPLVAAVARATQGRPVKFILPRAEEFVTVTKHAASITLKTGVRRDGRFTARQVTIHWNAGAYADASPLLIPQGMVRSIGPYRIPAVHVDSYGIYTNIPPAGAYRGAMSSQTTWAYESQMDMIAHRMGWDPLEFRKQNLLVSGEQFATGETLHDVHFLECLEASERGLEDLPTRPRLEAEAIKAGLKIGRGCGVMMKSTVASSKSSARVTLSDKGLVTLYTSTVEMGQGAHTALAQIVAGALDLPFEAMHVVGPDTDLTPFDSTTSASRSTHMMGRAVMEACASLRSRLLELGAKLFETTPDLLRLKDGSLWAGEDQLAFGDALRRGGLELLEAQGEASTSLGLDPETGQGVSTPHWHQGAGAVLVAVDVETGHVSLLAYSAAAFAGRVVNPRLAQLQNEGNVIFGLGPALMEEILLDGGQPVNPNLADYPIPSIRDTPSELVTLCIEVEGGELHGIGEMTLPPVAPAIANAIEAAVGVRVQDLPITAEKVLRLLKEKQP